jgi:hypothetical protein
MAARFAQKQSSEDQSKFWHLHVAVRACQWIEDTLCLKRVIGATSTKSHAQHTQDSRERAQSCR